MAVPLSPLWREPGWSTGAAASTRSRLETVTDLLAAWRGMLPQPAPPAMVSSVGAELLARWSEPHRHYHTVEHLSAVLAIVDKHADRAQDATAVRFAAWFHDAVYDPQRCDNEEASALCAEAGLPPLGVGRERVAEVARLIRLTASHDPLPGDRNGGLLTDADLAILAAPAQRYHSYTLAVRREYAHLSEAAFVTGRAAVLTNLLALPRLFHTPALRELWEEHARLNLAQELELLSR
jgi:predicted metal-dependent HD superfamily phosphohydrolase